MIREAIIKLSKKEDLTYDEAESVMNEIMEWSGNTGTDGILPDRTFHERRNH